MPRVARDPDAQRVERDLTLHAILHTETGEKMDALRAQAKRWARLIVKTCPVSRERSLALTKIEEGLFFAIASLARYQNGDDED